MHCGSCPVPETCRKIGGCVLKMKGYNENVSRKANQVIDNLLVGAAQPFSRDDVTIFRNNLQFQSYLDFIKF